MSQFPNPYSSPQYPGGQGLPPGIPDPLAKAKRAAVLMFIIGGLALLMGGCLGLGAMSVTKEQLRAAMEAQHNPAMEAPPLRPGLSPEESMLLAAKIVAVMGLIVGAILVALAVLVRRASKAATIVSLLFCGLGALFLIFQILGGLVTGLGSPQLLAGVCVLLVPVVLLSLASKWLIDALKALPQIDAMRQQGYSDYANSRKQMESHNQGAFGWGQGQGNYGQMPRSDAVPVQQPPIGYGAMPVPSTSKPAQAGPPVRHPPLPPEQQNSGTDPGNPPST